MVEIIISQQHTGSVHFIYFYVNYAIKFLSKTDYGSIIIIPFQTYRIKLKWPEKGFIFSVNECRKKL